MNLIFDIQKFCIHDGPGIRTTVFFKGCNMRCTWCHNPESFEMKKQLSYNKKKCVKCGKCASVCPNKVFALDKDLLQINYDLCNACGLCVENCFEEALTIIGKELSFDEIFDEVEKDRKYYESSGGGITFSGGEPTIQGKYLLDLVKESKKRNFHVAVETNCAGSKSIYEQISPYVDLFLVDYKISDPKLHKIQTGISKEIVMENIQLLNNLGKKIILRCPIIPTINDNDEHFGEIRKLIKKYKNIIDFEVMCYHDIGKDKWEKIGYDYDLTDLKAVEKALKEDWKKRIID